MKPRRRRAVDEVGTDGEGMGVVETFHDETRDRLLMHVYHVVVNLDIKRVRVGGEALPDALVTALLAIGVVEAIRPNVDPFVAGRGRDKVVKPSQGLDFFCVCDEVYFVEKATLSSFVSGAV